MPGRDAAVLGGDVLLHPEHKVVVGQLNVPELGVDHEACGGRRRRERRGVRAGQRCGPRRRQREGGQHLQSRGGSPVKTAKRAAHQHQQTRTHSCPTVSHTLLAPYAGRPLAPPQCHDDGYDDNEPTTTSMTTDTFTLATLCGTQRTTSLQPAAVCPQPAATSPQPRVLHRPDPTQFEFENCPSNFSGATSKICTAML